jgi:hypothetical protein
MSNRKAPVRTTAPTAGAATSTLNPAITAPTSEATEHLDLEVHFARKSTQGEMTMTSTVHSGLKKGIRPSLPLLLKALSPVVRPAMLEHFQPNCCIATCAILRRTFRYFGYNARPLAVSVQIFNSSMMRLLESGTPIPDKLKDRLALFQREKAWGIGIGIRDILISSPLGFDGHVVLQVGKSLVDASLAQADRPEHDIDLGAFIHCEPGHDFFHGADLPQYGIQGRGCAVFYRRLLDKTYRDSIDWNNWKPVWTQTLNKIIGQTIEGMITVVRGAV